MAHPNTNTLNYWSRAGTILLADMLGKVAGTADLNYWSRGIAIIFPAAIQPAATVTSITCAISASASVASTNTEAATSTVAVSASAALASTNAETAVSTVAISA